MNGNCGLYIGGFPCGKPAVYELQINDGETWHQMCAECTACCRAKHTGVTGVRQITTGPWRRVEGVREQLWFAPLGTEPPQ